MYRLSKRQTKELKSLWMEVSAAYPLTSPPETDDEVLAAGLDTWIAGVMSSSSQFTQKSLDDLVDCIDESGDASNALALADRVLALARSADYTGV